MRWWDTLTCMNDSNHLVKLRGLGWGSVCLAGSLFCMAVLVNPATVFEWYEFPPFFRMHMHVPMGLAAMVSFTAHPTSPGQWVYVKPSAVMAARMSQLLMRTHP